MPYIALFLKNKL